jgi:hypothetical protein
VLVGVRCGQPLGESSPANRASPRYQSPSRETAEAMSPGPKFGLWGEKSPALARHKHSPFVLAGSRVPAPVCFDDYDPSKEALADTTGSDADANPGDVVDDSERDEQLQSRVHELQKQLVTRIRAERALRVAKAKADEMRLEAEQVT